MMMTKPRPTSEDRTDPDFLPVKEVARRLSVTPRQVWRYIYDGELETVRIGQRSVRIPLASYLAYLARQADRD